MVTSLWAHIILKIKNSRKMFNYKFFGLNISSEIYFPELTPNNSKIVTNNVKIYFKKLNNFFLKYDKTENQFKVTDEGTFFLWDGKPLIKVHDNEIVVNPSLDINPVLLREFLLGKAFAELRHQQGLLVLHASAVNVNNQVIAFLGTTGQGKSTTAFALNKKGYPIISDDILPVETKKTDLPIIYPGHPMLRIFPDDLLKLESEKIDSNIIKKENSLKHLIKTKKFLYKQLPLKKIYILQRGETFSIKNLTQQEALVQLIKNSYCLPSFNNITKSINLLQCSNIVKNVSIKNLFIENSLERLPELVKIIENDVEN